MENQTRFRMKLGAAEIEYEGSSEFLKEQILPTVAQMIAIAESRTDLQRVPLLAQVEKSAAADTHQMCGAQHSTSTIAGLTNADSASELALAAAAHLTLFQKKDRMMRNEILDEMKLATAYYKASFASNHSNTLKMLVKADRLRSVATDTYSLSAKEKKIMEEKLAAAE
jgi:hypothetical protein